MKRRIGVIDLVRALAIAVAPLALVAATAANAAAQSITLDTFQKAKVVIGQRNFTNDGANDTGKTLDAPYGNAFESTGTLFVPDYNNSRVLGFKGIPNHNGSAAKFVLGQPDLNSKTSGDGADQMGGPVNLVVDGSQLFVTDYGDNRVLIWNAIPKKTATPADIVLGQAGFGTGEIGCGPSSMYDPETLWVADGKLIVGDSDNNRVLIWNTIPTASGAAPDLVLGQQNLSTCVRRNNGSGVSGAPNASNFDFPAGVWTDGTRVVVADYDDHRVLIWNTFPTANDQAADVVLGQTDFTSDVADNDGSGVSGAISASNFGGVYDGLYSNGTQLFVADYTNDRVMVWNTFPTTNFQAADVVLGQPDFSCGAENSAANGSCTQGPSANAQGFNDPEGIIQIGKKLIVTDESNNRYLIFDQAKKKK